jgi:2'-5' RNA ligase
MFDRADHGAGSPHSATDSIPSSQHSESVFFAVKPTLEAANAILDVADILRRTCGLAGRTFDASTLHITLCEIGHPKSQLAPLERALTIAGSAVRYPTFDIVLDRAMGFDNPTNGFPSVLVADRCSGAALAGLRTAIAVERLRQGLVVKGSYKPHLTLSRSSTHWIHDAPIERVAWRATEFLLIHSYHDGQNRCHDVIERWALAS